MPMKTSHHTSHVCASLVAAVAFSSWPVSALAQAAGQDSATARQEIEDQRREVIDLFKAGEFAQIAELFTEDGVYVAPGRPDIVGRAALAEFYEGIRNLRLVNLTLDTSHFFVEGDIAIEGGFSTEEWRDVSTDARYRSTLRYMYVFQRQTDGRWLVRYLMETPAAPAPEGA